MNLKSIFTTLIVALSPVAAGASTLPFITVTSGTDQKTGDGLFDETVGNFAFQISTDARDETRLGYLQALIYVEGLRADSGTATVDVIKHYESFEAFDLMRLRSTATVGDITGIEPVLPENTSITVQHFIKFDLHDEIALGDFPFGNSEGSMEDFDTIDYLGPYQLRSLYTFTCADDTLLCIAEAEGTIRATPAPVPVPAGILLLGTALVGFGVVRRKAKKAAV